MVTTIFLITLISFELWYLTSKRFKQKNSVAYLGKIKSNGQAFRILAALLFLIAIALFVLKLGWTSGIIASIVALMAAGSLIVTIQPFRYIQVPVLGALYLTFLLFEIFIY